MYVICCFSSVPFNIFYLYLIFVSLINMCLSVFLLGFILHETLGASWTWLTISFHIRKFSTIISSNIFSSPFSFFFFFWYPYNLNVGTEKKRDEKTVLISFHSFFFILFHGRDFLPFCLPGHLPIFLPQVFCY